MRCLSAMAVRAAHHALRELIFQRRNGCANIDHAANVVSLFINNVIELEDDWVTLAAINT
jgi:hypothetical protein